MREQLANAYMRRTDGINLDFEFEVAQGSQQYYALTELVKNVTEMFHEAINGSQVGDLFIVPAIKTCSELTIETLNCALNYFKVSSKNMCYSEAYLEPSRVSAMEVFCEKSL